MNRRYLCIGMLLSVFIGGCVTVGPNYQPPQMPVPAAWNGLPEKGVKTGTAEDIKWWSCFGDSILDSLVEQAAKSNLDLRLAESRWREARALRRVIAADSLPSLNTTAAYSRNRRSENATPSAETSGGQGSVAGISGAFSSNQDYDFFQFGFDAGWELDLFGGVRRSIEAAEADTGAAAEARLGAMVSLLGEVARNYIELRGWQQQLAIAGKNVEIQQDTLGLTRVRHEAGLGTEMDVSRIEAQVAATESQIPQLKSSLQKAVYRLGVLLGREPGALTKELTPVAPIPTSPLEVLVDLPAELLRRRPDIRKAERELAAATARIGVATAALYPSFSLSGLFGFQSIELKKLVEWPSRFWSIGPAITFPIFDGGRIRANIQVQDARQEQALINYEKTVLGAMEDVENALTAFGHEQERLARLVEAVDANQRTLEMIDDLYTKGLTDFINVLDVERSLFNSQSELVQSQVAVSSNLVALYKALGGGWEVLKPL